MYIVGITTLGLLPPSSNLSSIPLLAGNPSGSAVSLPCCVSQPVPVSTSGCIMSVTLGLQADVSLWKLGTSIQLVPGKRTFTSQVGREDPIRAVYHQYVPHFLVAPSCGSGKSSHLHHGPMYCFPAYMWQSGPQTLKTQELFAS